MADLVDKMRISTFSPLLLGIGLVLGACGGNEAQPEPAAKTETAEPAQQAGESLPAKDGSEQKPWSRFVEELENPDAIVRKSAADQLGAVGPEAASAIKPLALLLEDSEKEVRIAAAGAIGKIGPLALAATTALVERLGDENAEVRAAAGGALEKIGHSAAPTVVRIIERYIGTARDKAEKLYLEEKEWRMVANAAVVLGAIGQGTDTIYRLLMRLAKLRCQEASSMASCHAVKSAAAEALGSMGASSVPLLIEGLKDENPEVRVASAKALGVIGPEAISAEAALLEMLKEQDAAMTKAAALALSGIGSKAALRPLLDALHDMRPMIREPAVRALILMGPGAKEAIPELKKLLNDKKKWTRRAAEDVLKQIADNGK